MVKQYRSRKASLAQPVTVVTRVERETRDAAKRLGMNVAEILREEFTMAVEAEMRKHNYQHTMEVPEIAEQRSWLSNLKWW